MSLIAELKRRNVFRVAAAYVVAAWVIIEVSSLVLEIYQSPDSVIRIIVALLALGLHCTSSKPLGLLLRFS